MIAFNNICDEKPYMLLHSFYEIAVKHGQANPEAICISSFCPSTKQVNSRFVNLKFINNKKFIFFTNYNSPKAKEFLLNKKISIAIYWNKINTQIRIQANIKKTSKIFNESYFSSRDKNKNALAISSKQSKVIDSYDSVIENYNLALKNANTKKCPDYWGGFSFVPHQFEFWQGSEFRLNKRDLYNRTKKGWNHTILEP